MARIQVGSEFLVNTTTHGNQDSLQVTALKHGRFVVTWQSNEVITNSSDLRGVFAADGTAGSDFLVNTTTAGEQGDAAQITALCDGGFVATWHSLTNYGVGDYSYEVRGRVFAANGTPVGNDFRVSTTTTGAEVEPDITALADGGFIVVWNSPTRTSDYDIRGRLFAADGTAGSKFVVTTTAADAQLKPQVTALSDGRFLVS